MKIKMFDYKRALATCCFVTISLVSHSSWANLIENGGFEADSIDDPSTSVSGFEFVSTGELAGWTVNSNLARGAVLFNSDYGQPVGGGLQSLQLESIGDSISQSISTVIGQTYMLSFDLSAFANPGTGSVNVGVDGDDFLFTGTASSYITYTMNFAANSTSTLISFTSTDNGSGHFFPHLDDISVVAVVPLPGAIWFFGSGLLGFFSIARRKAQ